MASYTILLVEDDDGDAKAVERTFLKARIANPIVRALDGIQALEIMKGTDRNQPLPPPYLLLVDLNMPRMNGREFLAEIKKDPELSVIPVVVLTTSDVERDVVASYKLGAAGYITKPVDMEQFIDAIRQLDSYWFVLARLPMKN